MHLKTSYLICVLVVSLLLTLICSVAAEEIEEEIEAEIELPVVILNLYKNSGFGSDNSIDGRWTVNAATSQNISYVEFYLDTELQYNDTFAPFSWFFDTQNYPQGYHTIQVIAYDVYGQSATASVERTFVGFPVFTVVAVVVVAVVGFVFLLVVSWFWIKSRAARMRRQKKSSIYHY